MFCQTELMRRMVEIERLELPTSCSQNTSATNCAISRYVKIRSFKSILTQSTFIVQKYLRVIINIRTRGRGQQRATLRQPNGICGTPHIRNTPLINTGEISPSFTICIKAIFTIALVMTYPDTATFTNISCYSSLRNINRNAYF